jgi:hypothetical protein
MSTYKDRQKLFDQLISHRKRKVATLITSTKKPEQMFATQIAQDILPIFYDVLKQEAGGRELDLIIHSSGGQIDTPWPFINLIREYYDDLCVLVPWRAQSAATLICLGANTIEMGPLASMSPIDPQFQLTLGDKKVGAGVEDIYGYYMLIEERLRLSAQGRAEALKILANRITPEVLGKISRTRREIRIIAKNLLGLHLADEKVMENIVSNLVEELPSHQYLINRKEAKALGLPVVDMDKETELISFKILDSYRQEAKMDEPGVSVNFDSGETTKVIEMSRAFIETRDRSFAFISQYTFRSDGKVDRKGNQWKEVTPK